MNIIRSSWKEQYIELLVFLFLIAPSMLFSFFIGKVGSINFVLTAYASILREVALVSLILYFLWRNGENIDSIGCRLKGINKEIALGIGLLSLFSLA